MSAIDDFLKNNSGYAAGFAHGELSAAPARSIAVVCCMDARIDTASVLGLEVGGAHVIRNAGAILTDDVVRSLTISQRKLGTREIMLIQHTQCGLLSFTDGEFADELERETGRRPEFAMGTFNDLESNVRESIEQLRANPFLAHTDAICGFVYEVETGKLRKVST